MLAGIIYAGLGLIEFLIGMRFLFRIIGANPNSGFVDWIYDWSTPFVAPFSGIFGQDATATGTPGAVTQSVFDWTAVIAFIVYGIIGAILLRLVVRAAPRY